MPLFIVRNTITSMQADAIVNTANPQPVVGSGVDSAIHAAAGPALLEARREIGQIRSGTSAITPAFLLPAKYVIHTVGPVWQDGGQGEEETLSHCYETALQLAADHKCKSVAFPLISAGTYGFPKDLALQTAICSISSFLLHHEEMVVYLVVFDRTAYALSEKLFADVKSYIDENLVEALHGEEYMANIRPSAVQPDRMSRRGTLFLRESCSFDSVCLKEERSLSDLLGQLGESFPQALERIIREKGMKNAEVYTRANMTRQHFSKILNREGYQPGKEKVLALAIALRLNLDETRDFLGRAGYALTKSSKTDIIVQYFIETGNYDIFEVEKVLFEFTGRTLASY